MGQPHETLVAWQRADDFCVAIFDFAKRYLPVDERYELASQLKRAAFSVPANIVEGYAFPEGPMRTRHLRTAVASLAEVGYGLHLAQRVGYLKEPDYSILTLQMRKTAAPLHGLLRRSAAKSKARRSN